MLFLGSSAMAQKYSRAIPNSGLVDEAVVVGREEKGEQKEKQTYDNGKITSK